VPTAVFNPDDNAIAFLLRADRDGKISANAIDIILEQCSEAIGELFKVNIDWRQVMTGGISGCIAKRCQYIGAVAQRGLNQLIHIPEVSRGVESVGIVENFIQNAFQLMRFGNN